LLNKKIDKRLVL